MRKLTLLLVSLVLLSIQSVLAQSFSVKGTVVSAEDNEPMIGVTIMQEGTSNGVVTDIDGNYTIEIKGASKAMLCLLLCGLRYAEARCESADKYAQHHPCFGFQDDG